MLKVYETVLCITLAIFTFGIVHSGTVAASSFEHIESSSTQQSSSACQPICHSSPASNKAKLVDIKKDEREPTPPLSGLDKSATVPLAKSLLDDRGIWKLSSWMPPDQLLISSAYTTSL